MENVKGIDVSKWQGTIDFNKVKADGIRFAILREGFRQAIDGNFIEYVKGMKAAGIQILGVYHFIYIDGATPTQNANACVSNMKAAGLDCANTWIFADLEYDAWNKAGVKVTKALCTQYTKEFLETLKSLGCKKLGIYCNLDYYKNYYDWNQLAEYRKYLWLADWSGGPDVECMVHQYSDSTKVNGISGNVDGDYLVDANTAGFVVDSAKETKSEVNYMTENELRQKPVKWLEKYLGISEGSAGHKEILKVFNDSNLCTRYKMTVSDAWCATAVSAAFIACGLAGKQGSGSLFECVECSCGNMTSYSQKQGIWMENDAYVPKTGDVIMYDWDDSGSGDDTGWPDHVGIVVSVSGNKIKVIEGNASDTVLYRTIAVNGKNIRGYIIPKYANFAGKVVNEPEVEPEKPAQKNEFAVGDIVEYTGNVHYVSSNSTSPKACKPGEAKVTATYNGKHPYHLIATSNSASSVYGWVDADLIKSKRTEEKPAESNKTEVRASNYANYFDRSLAGTYKTIAGLHCRDGAGTSHKSLVVIPEGTEVQCYGYYNVVSGTKWLYIQFTLKGVKYTGFSSSKYLKKK